MSRSPDPALQTLCEALAGDRSLADDFERLCDCGGRRAGTASEQAALDLLRARLGAIGPARAEAAPYAGWRDDHAAMKLLPELEPLACKALLGSQSTADTGLEAEVVDLGRGTQADFDRAGARLNGRIALVRHEYPFSATHIHRRRKYNWAIERGAVGFIIASPDPDGGTVCGSSGRGGGTGIPAVATDHRSALRLAATGARRARVALEVRGEDHAAQTQVLILELPGRTADRIVLSAHLDGHDLAESAMDNASGVAVALALGRALAPHAASCRRGLTLCLFSAEEWALAGSASWLDRMDAARRRAIALNVNLDTVGGDSRLTALTSGFAGLERFVADTSAAIGTPVGVYRPMMANSDHYNFARHGIPALRLVAGFDRPDSNVRYILSRADTRDRVRVEELVEAARVACALVWRAMNLDHAEIDALR